MKNSQSVKVKELEWVENRYEPTGSLVEISANLFGRERFYSIEPVTANANFRLFIEGKIVAPPDGYYWPLEAAKAAAQADYEGRILSALSAVHAKAGVSVEGLREIISDLVSAEVENVTAYMDGGAPSDRKEAEIRESLRKANGALDEVLSALSTKIQEPVGEVVWYDPKSDMLMFERPHKIIDASIEFMENAPLGTKLYASPPALAHQPVTTGWEGVETAPKDEVVLLSWWDHHGKQWEYEAGLYGSTRGGWLHGQATYWKRISAPAALKSEGRK